MLGKIALVDGKIVPEEQARIPVDDIAFSYGYGVYENLKVRNRALFFANEHVDRLLRSAEEIGLRIKPGREEILTSLRMLIGRLKEDSFNVKLLAVGERMFAFATNPHYIPEKAYRDGITAITVRAQRPFPRAKTLSMLASYLAYERARAAGAYDALLVDGEGFVHEGTRTNLFVTDGTAIATPPGTHALEGVTRAHVIASLGDIPLRERLVTERELAGTAGAFLSSTSSGVVPVSLIDGRAIPIPPIVREAIRRFGERMERCRAEQERIPYAGVH
jgi:branched-subunit amino acid aminotransferase/4-amino-4-deoxychorismate lyase